MKKIISVLMLLIPVLCFAQGYPNRPLRMIVPFAPGGASDFVGRILQPRMSELLGQQVLVENRGGAAGNIGVEAGARSAPDGYTFVLGNIGSIAINPAVFPNLSVTPTRDLIAVTQVVDVPSVLVAHPSFPPNNIKEVIEYDLARRLRRTLAWDLPVGAPPGVTPKFIGPIGTFSGPMGSFAAIAVDKRGTLYLSGDAEGSVLALHPT